MLYFIPAWYQENSWHENEQIWYTRRMHTEFDDTVKQVQLFNRNATAPFSLLLLSYAPNLRHFLHRQGVFHVTYWSLFDAIQQVDRRQIFMLSFRNLSWPEGVEFIYSPFSIVANVRGEKYAQIEFGEDGNPIRVDMFQNEQIIRSNIYDDRGFLSATTVYREGKPFTRDYLTPEGIWKLRYFHADGHVEINPAHREYVIHYENVDHAYDFRALSYPNMDEAIREVLEAFVECTGAEDVFCIAMHERHMSVLEKTLNNHKKILSFFGERIPIAGNTFLKDMIEDADYIIADSQNRVNEIVGAFMNAGNKIISITPYDSRVDIGISQQLDRQKIVFPVDQLSPQVFEEAIRTFAAYYPENPYAEIHILTRTSYYRFKEDVMKRILQILTEAGIEEDQEGMPGYEKPEREFLETEEQEEEGEEESKSAIPIARYFIIDQCVDELSVSRCMREQRVMVDIRPVPDLYLQITCISMGIPQIVFTETEYIINWKNGLKISSIQDLPDALNYYLDGLVHWNEAMVQAFEIGKQYTTQNILKRWRKVIETIG